MRRRCIILVVRSLFIILMNVARIDTFVLWNKPVLMRWPSLYREPALFVSSDSSSSSASILHNKPSDVDVKSLLRNVKDVLQQRGKGTACDRETILSRLDERHAADCEAALVLAAEETSTQTESQPPPYEWIHVKNHPLAIQSVGTSPIMNATDIHTLRTAAEHYWQQQQHNNSRKSRFTYQRVGNSEAHVSDLGMEAKQVMNRVLINSIYPLVRAAFYDDDDNSKLCVYDALYIRYNATEANNNMGAGQPLHRDLGIVSVNIMLNSQEEFKGGGTFFENQLRDDESRTVVVPLKPVGLGHCLAHYSAERHAGAATIDGVRDILVIFVTAAQMNHSTTPRLIHNARLKQCARFDCEKQCNNNVEESILCRIQHQMMAIDAVLDDAEAFQYLGITLMEYAEQDSDENSSMSILNTAIDCFRHAASLTPCDSRVYSSLGLALSRRQDSADNDSTQHESSIISAYEKARELLIRSNEAGCDVENDVDALSLNYGLYLANLDRFVESYRVLERTARKTKEDAGGAPEETTTTSRVVHDAYRLWKFCERNM